MAERAGIAAYRLGYDAGAAPLLCALNLAEVASLRPG
jgi:hypothetical protein